mgnify:CR=1 FL=1|jgi:hypothetical protein
MLFPCHGSWWEEKTEKALRSEPMAWALFRCAWR